MAECMIFILASLYIFIQLGFQLLSVIEDVWQCRVFLTALTMVRAVRECMLAVWLPASDC